MWNGNRQEIKVICVHENMSNLSYILTENGKQEQERRWWHERDAGRAIQGERRIKRRKGLGDEQTCSKLVLYIINSEYNLAGDVYPKWGMQQ